MLYLLPHSAGPFAPTWTGYAESRILRGEIDPLIIIEVPSAAQFYEYVLPYVERNFRILPLRAYRAIAGYSAGAGPALQLSRANVFSLVGVFEGGAPAELDVLVRSYDANRYPTHIWVWQGRSDTDAQLRRAASFVAALEGWDHTLYLTDDSHHPFPAAIRQDFLADASRGFSAVPMRQPPLIALAPDTLVAGTRVTLRATVRPPRLDGETQTHAIRADLSDLGGPANIPLTPDSDGTFQMQATFEVSATSGTKELTLTFEQESQGTPYSYPVEHGVAVFPHAALPILTQSLAAGWQLSAQRGVDVATDGTTPPPAQDTESAGPQVLVYEGSANWWLDLRRSTPIDPMGYTTLQFLFHPGDNAADAGSLSTLDLQVNDKRLKVSGTSGAVGSSVQMESPTWQQIEVPLAALGIRGKSEPIEKITFWGRQEGTFYLADIRLVADLSVPGVSTAVVENQQISAPIGFVLGPNYPNPFNPETTIRFGLPQSQEIELAIYNLAAQRVATLVTGHREAGSYSVRWDGVTDAGLKLASGVYFYRLTAGEQVETRKLLLLR